MKIYYTLDSDGHWIDASAEIRVIEAPSVDAAATILINRYQHEWDNEDERPIRFVPGSFGDCWICCYRALDPQETFEPFERNQLSIRDPGSHPGGKAIWINPTEPVYVLTKEEE